MCFSDLGCIPFWLWILDNSDIEMVEISHMVWYSNAGLNTGPPFEYLTSEYQKSKSSLIRCYRHSGSPLCNVYLKDVLFLFVFLVLVVLGEKQIVILQKNAMSFMRTASGRIHKFREMAKVIANLLWLTYHDKTQSIRGGQTFRMAGTIICSKSLAITI